MKRKNADKVLGRVGIERKCEDPVCPCQNDPDVPKGRVYLAGPMSGHPDMNFAAFFEAEEILKDLGWRVVNPARIDVEGGYDPATDPAEPSEFYMKRDIPLLVACDAIALLPGWRDSKGAKDEFTVAQMCGLDVISAADGAPIPWLPSSDFWLGDDDPYDDGVEADPSPESPLFEAYRLVHGDRGADYGAPFCDFARTGRMWGAILDIASICPEKVALCLIALKLSREAHHHKRDSLVDMAGYVETLAMIEHESA